MRVLRPGAEALQWIGVFAAPLAWTAQLVLGYGATLASCESPATRLDLSIVGWEIAVTAVAAVIALGGEAAAIGAWRASRSSGLPDERRRFFAQVAVLGSILFLVAILLGGITAATEAPLCRQA